MVPWSSHLNRRSVAIEGPEQTLKAGGPVPGSTGEPVYGMQHGLTTLRE